MKAIVLEIKEDWAAVLTDEGEFRKLRDRGWEVGQQLSEAEMSGAETAELSGEGELPSFAKAVKGHIWKKQLRTAIAAALVVAVLGAGGWTYTGVYAADSTVTVDVEDTSVEYTLNRHGEVISLRGLNEGGEEYVAAVGGEKPEKRRPLEDALEEMMESLKSEGKIGDYKTEDDEDYMVVGISSRNEKRGAAIRERIENAPIGYDEDRMKLFLLEDDPDDDTDFTGNIDEMLKKAGGPSRAERDAMREAAVKAHEAGEDKADKAQENEQREPGSIERAEQNSPRPMGEESAKPGRPSMPKAAPRNDAGASADPNGQAAPLGEPGEVNGERPNERNIEEHDTDNSMLPGGAGTLPDDVPQQEGAGSEQRQMDRDRGQVPPGGEPGGMPQAGGQGGDGNPPEGMALPGSGELHPGQRAGGAYVPVYGVAA